jgi:A/G-specific adenine glycosylase
MSIGIQRSTLNAQRSTFNDLLRWTLDVERWMFVGKIVISTKSIHSFRHSLLRWYRRHGRDLPWRHTRDPYEILVSEVMLQQTQVATVLPYYNRWLRRFPNIAALVRASEGEVLRLWEGLGYYARARNLLAAAKIVGRGNGGALPREVGQLRQLPGIGRYTANAVATFAFDQSVPIVEANTARLLGRLFDIQNREELWDAATTLVPKYNAGRFNSALIDLGATICLPRNPRCGLCPVKRFCRSRDGKVPSPKATRAKTISLTENHALVVSGQKILLQQSINRWRGLWILPSLKLDCFKQSSLAKPIHTSVFPFTNHRITLHVFRHPPSRKINSSPQRWFFVRRLGSIPIPSPHRRAISALLH